MTTTELTALWGDRDAQRVSDIAAMERSTEAKLTAFRALPTIITEAGDYVTRDGRRVTIQTIGRLGGHGGIWKEFRGKMRAKGYLSWDFNGRRNFLNERASDIVGTYPALVAA